MENTFTSEFYLQNKTSKYAVYLFYIVIVTILLLRIGLIGHGITFFADESRYFFSIEAVKEFSQGNFTKGFYLLNSTQGRPGDAFIRLLPAVIQAVMYKKWGINTNTPDSLIVAVVMNWVVLVINTVLFYKIAVRLHGRSVAQVATVAYVSLVNSNVYLRHILPYDMAICFFLLALLLLLKKQNESLSINKLFYFKIGALSGLCFAVYPGYFLAPLILGVLILQVSIKNLKQQFLYLLVEGAVFAAGFVFVVGLIEITARCGGTSYLMSSRELSTTINLGDFSDGFSFAPKYLIIVEGFLGWILLGALPIALFFLIKDYWINNHSVEKKHINQTEKTAAMLILSWFCYASLAYFWHSLVFYGRTLHLFMPLLVLVCSAVLLRAKHWKPDFYTVACCMLMLFCLGSFLGFYKKYLHLLYAKDELYAKGIYYPFPVNTWRYNNVCSGQDTEASPFQRKYIKEGPGKELAPSDTVVLLNFGYIFPTCSPKPITLLEPQNRRRLKLLAKGPVTAAFTPYQFEGWNAAERAVLSSSRFDFMVYKLASAKAL